MRVIGIDPGSRALGFAVVDAAGSRLRLVDIGVIRPPAGSLAMRLHYLAQQVALLIGKHRPQYVGVETSYWGRGAQSSLKIGEVRGVVLAAAAAVGIEPAEISPAEVKKAVTGRGQAHKQQVEFMVRRMLRLDGEIRPRDAADALALAVAVVHRSGG